MNGAQTVPRILALRPTQKILLASGNSDEVIAKVMEQHPNIHRLRKPFSLRELREKVASLCALESSFHD
jgi:hypothetical protein